jgi:hypothetical protein
LSCGDTVSSQKLANALGALDKAAQLKMRKIIAWNDEVALYETGAIRGIGRCKIYEASKKSIELTIGIPKGKIGASQTGNCVVMSGVYSLKDVTNWSWSSTKTFGHAFTYHGKAEFNYLVERLKNDKAFPEQGHWLDNVRAAAILESAKEEIDELEL